MSGNEDKNTSEPVKEEPEAVKEEKPASDTAATDKEEGGAAGSSAAGSSTPANASAGSSPTSENAPGSSASNEKKDKDLGKRASSTGSMKQKSKSDDKKKTTKKTKSKSPVESKTKLKSISSGNKKKSSHKAVDIGNNKIGIVGGGKMAEAIAKGLITSAKIDPKKVFVAAKTGRNLDFFKGKGMKVTKRSYDIFGQFDCDIVFLCIHGFVIRSCFKGGGLRPFAFTVNYIPNQKHQLTVLSLIGGVTLDDIKLTMLDPDNPGKYMLAMHRCMLNIGVAYGTGLGAIDVEIKSKKLQPTIRNLLQSITSELEYYPEQMMDAICTIGGAGLAFSYYFIQALADGGAKMGLNKNMATKLGAIALQTAAQSLLASGKHPTELQDNSIPPGGPAIYGIQQLEKADVAGGLKGAVDEAYKRLKELVDIEPGVEKEAKPVAKPR